MPDLADARWFPVDADVRGGRIAFLELSDAVIGSASFLDNRVEAPLGQSQVVSVDQVPQGLVRSHVGWLFHTSFCCSTLLARALHFPPHQICLKEPLVLRRLGDAREEGVALGRFPQIIVDLLARRRDDGASIVIKPTHAALNVATDLLRETPAARAVVLTSDLDDFLVSNLKKTAETQAKIPQLAQRALRAGHFRHSLPEQAFEPPSLLCAAALQWAAQRELALDIQQAAGTDRVWILDQRELLDDVAAMAGRVAQWLGLDPPAEAFAAHVAAVSQRHAKVPDTAYGSEKRDVEKQMVANMFSAELQSALIWAQRYLLPYMRQSLTVVTNE
ncbi:hypothetical protein GCM10027159_32270 [Lysobacter terrae]